MASDERKPAKPAAANARPAASNSKAAERTRLIAAFEPLSDRLLGVNAAQTEVYGYFNSTDSEELLTKYAPFSASSPLLRLGKEVARLLEMLAAEDRNRLIKTFVELLANPRGETSRPLAESEPYRLRTVGPYRIVFWYDRPFDAVRIALIDRRSDDPVTHAIDRFLAL
jgi:mRNA-degrading endonuclease RelE of RelBE toxin-antitoxin system